MKAPVKYRGLMFGIMCFFCIISGCSGPPGSSAAHTADSTDARDPGRVGEPEPLSHAPAIIDYGPRDIAAGVAFNRQPDGQAAVWVHMSSSLEGSDAVIKIDGTMLQSSIKEAQITGLVPGKLYAKPGKLMLSVVQHENGAEVRSGPVALTVH